MKIIGIDVSTWQGKINWNQVKSSDVKFAILRSSFGSPDPSQAVSYTHLDVYKRQPFTVNTTNSGLKQKPE